MQTAKEFIKDIISENKFYCHLSDNITECHISDFLFDHLSNTDDEYKSSAYILRVIDSNNHRTSVEGLIRFTNIIQVQDSSSLSRFIKFTGTSDSWGGEELEDIFFVEPVEKTYIDYVRVKED